MCDGDYHSILSYFAALKDKGEESSLHLAHASSTAKFTPFWSGMAVDDFVRTL